MIESVANRRISIIVWSTATERETVFQKNQRDSICLQPEALQFPFG